MRELFILIAHLLVTLAKLGRPGGLGAVAAESLAVKHQLLIMKRAQHRAPNLTSWDRLVLGVCALLVSPKRLSKMAVILKPSTLLCFHHALVKRKYRLLYSPRKRRRPGPKGPSKELIGVVIEMKRRNPRFGCRKIAEQISRAFAVEINKDIVRRILIQHYRPVPGGDGPSWLTVIGHAKDSLWSVDFFRCESILLKSCWVMVVMDVFTRRIIGFGVAVANLDGTVICRMFNRAIAKQTPPRCLSSDHDPLFRFHRWLANLRVLEVDEIKAVPCTPRSHAFVERLIGTVRREYLDRTLFWNQSDLERKLENYKVYYNQHRCHSGLGWPELRPLNGAAYPHRQSQNLSHIPGGNIAKAHSRPQLPPELEFDTDRSFSCSASRRSSQVEFSVSRLSAITNALA
jgi:putative transposase